MNDVFKDLDLFLSQTQEQNVLILFQTFLRNRKKSLSSANAIRVYEAIQSQAELGFTIRQI